MIIVSLFFPFYSWWFPCREFFHLSCHGRIYIKCFSFLRSYDLSDFSCNQVCLDMQVSCLEWFVSETIKALDVCFDSKWGCSLRIIYCLESRIITLSGFVYEVLRERNLFVIFGRKIGHSTWRESNSSGSTKVKGISWKILVIGIYVVTVIKRKSLFLFKSTVLVLTLFEIY